jgi:GT2 family glycosyltransferase
MNTPIDIFLTTYLRQAFTEKTIEYLYERTKYPFRLFVIDNGGNDAVLEEALRQNKVFLWVKNSYNVGIHAAWNMALSMAESEYFITSDNDIWVPDLEPDWLTQMVKFMDERPDYGAISLHPHVLIGSPSFEPKDPEDVKEVGHCGAVMRIMRVEAVRKSGGWEHEIKSSRNHEELTVCSRLQTNGYKCGRTTRIRAYHPFKTKDNEPGSSWGYPPEFSPEKQGHRPELAEYVKAFDNPDAYDGKTWLPKI